jgi:hypothetical protein
MTNHSKFPSDPFWRKSSRSNDSGGNCVEVASIHDAPWRKSSRSNNNGQCVEAAQLDAIVAIRDSKLDTSGDFPHLRLSAADWAGLLSAIRADTLG